MLFVFFEVFSATSLYANYIKKIISRICKCEIFKLAMLKKKMPHPIIFSQSHYLIQVVDTMTNNGNPDQLDLHCLQRQGISGFNRTRVNSGDLLNTAYP